MERCADRWDEKVGPLCAVPCGPHHLTSSSGSREPAMTDATMRMREPVRPLQWPQFDDDPIADHRRMGMSELRPDPELVVLPAMRRNATEPARPVAAGDAREADPCRHQHRRQAAAQRA